MKKILGLMAMLLLAITVTSCGNDEPTPPAQPKKLYSALADGQTNYETTTERYYWFDINMAPTQVGSYIYLYNFKFVPQMPVTVNLRIDLATATVVKTASGYDVTCTTAIIPELNRGTIFTPQDDRPITNLVLNIDNKKMTYSIAFDCSGLHFTDSGNLINL